MWLLKYLEFMLLLALICLSVFNFQKEKVKASDRWLFVFFLSFLGLDLVELESFQDIIQFHLYGILFLLIGISLNFYSRTFIQSVPIHQILLHLIIPFLFFVNLYYILIVDWKSDSYLNSILFRVQLLIFFSCMLVYGVISMMYVQKITYSSITIERNKIQWLRLLNLSFLGYITLIFSLSIFGDSVLKEELLEWITSGISIILTFTLIYFAIKFNIIYLSHSNEKQHQANDKNWNELFQKIDTKVKAEALYLNAELKIDDLAKSLQINQKYISQAINQVYGSSVSNYINDFRIQLFKEKVIKVENQKYNLHAIAVECGFNSKSSFNRIFKEKTGLTPSAYKAQMSQDSKV